jgi:hypothetical protein
MRASSAITLTRARPASRVTRAALVAAGAFAGIAVQAASPQLYELTTETAMPHLEENLRYATRTETRCLRADELVAAFWMLREPALQDCRLTPSAQADAPGTYALQCDGGHGTTGGAEWRTDGDSRVGTLRVRLGGKNMTFSQRITARPLGTCPQ